MTILCATPRSAACTPATTSTSSGSVAAVIYMIFVVFLGPAFVMGICRNFDPNATNVWVARALVCANATAVVNVTDGTLAAMLPGASPDVKPSALN